jgi:hypothetical protein
LNRVAVSALLCILGFGGLFPCTAQAQPLAERQAARTRAADNQRASQASVKAENDRFERAMQECARSTVASLCSEREIEGHRRVLPELQRQVHISSQAVRNEAAYDRSLDQAQRIEKRQTKPDPAQGLTQNQANKQARHRAKMERIAQSESASALAKRAKSVARYESKQARHREKLAKLETKRTLRDQKKASSPTQ